MSDPAPSHSSSLDSLAPGVVLSGRYSLKDRVPRWIAERRFKARDLETGDIVAILAWPDSVPWLAALNQKAEDLLDPPFREIGRRPGLVWIVTQWTRGMRELTGEADTADAVLDQLQKSQTPAPEAPPQRRTAMRTSPAPSAPVASEPRRRAVSETAPPAPPAPTATWLDFVSLGIGLVVAVVVMAFAWQMMQGLREPLVIEKKSTFAIAQIAPSQPRPTRQLTDAQTLRKNGNSTSALELLLELQARTPGDLAIQAELNDLLRSLEGDLDSLRAGLRPPLVRAIDRAAESGNAEARRLQLAISATPDPAETPATSPEPLPIR